MTLALERLLARRPEGTLVNPLERGEMGRDLSIPRRAADAVIGHCKNFHSLGRDKASELGVQ